MAKSSDQGRSFFSLVRERLLEKLEKSVASQLNKLFFSENAADVIMMQGNAVILSYLGVNKTHFFDFIFLENNGFVLKAKRGICNDCGFADFLFSANRLFNF